LEAKNFFTDLAARDSYVSSLSPPNQDALAEMGVHLTTQMGSIVSNTLTASSSASSSPPQQSAPSSSGGVQAHKTKWPELKNTPAAEALKIISEQRPDVKAMLVPQVERAY